MRTQSIFWYRYHVYSLPRGLDVAVRDPGLVLTVCGELGTGSEHEVALRVNGDASSADSSNTAHLQ